MVNPTTAVCSPSRSARTSLSLAAGTLFLVLASVSLAAPPPSFKLKDLDGHWFSVDEHLGRDVIYIDFWATWCVPCRREMPHLQKMFDDLHEQGLLVVSVNTDPPANRSKIKPFVRRHRLSFPCLLDPDNTVHDKFNPGRELPYGVLIDRQGTVHRVYPGYRAGDEALLRKEIVALLAAPPATSEHADPASHRNVDSGP